LSKPPLATGARIVDMATTTTTVPSVWPAITYRDSRAALDFLTRAFGFTERAVYADGDTIRHVELTWPAPDGTVAGGVMFGPPDDCATAQPRYGTNSVHVVVSDPDALFTRAVAAGATVLRGLEDTAFGSRQFVVHDPEGNTWSFGTWYE
jgi:uncharacterized glyoxalase superfamily protein PhnB